jgi:hypothetical protein
MKNSAVLFLFLLLNTTCSLLAQKTTLVLTVSEEGTNMPVPAAELFLFDKFKEPLTTLITDNQGRITYVTNKTPLFVNIRSNDLRWKSGFEQISLPAPSQDTCFRSIVLALRDSAEIAHMKRGLQKLQEDKNQPAYTCTGSAQQNTNPNIIDSCLKANLHYPEKAREWNLTARVKVKFFVDTNGLVCGIELQDHTYTILEEEILRALSSLSGLPVITCKGQKYAGFYMMPVRIGEW